MAEFLRTQQGWTVEQLAAFHPGWPAEAVREKHTALARWDPETLAVVRDYPVPRAVPVPSLVITGGTRSMVGESVTEQLSAEGFKARTVPDTGHVVHKDDFDGFGAALDGWL